MSIDVSKSRLNVTLLPGGGCWSVAKDAAENTLFVRRLKERGVPRTVLGATGRLETAVVASIAYAARILVAANRRHVSVCAKAGGQLGKTHRIDASVPPLLAGRVRPEPGKRVDENGQHP